MKKLIALFLLSAAAHAAPLIGTNDIKNSSVINSKLGLMNNSTIKCNVSGGSANPSDCTGGQVGTVIGALIGSNNLSDLPNAGTARTNLGFPAFASQGVLFGAASTIPSTDNNFFAWDVTNHFLGIGFATPAGRLDVTNTGDTLAGNLVLWGQGRGANSEWVFYDNPGGDLAMYNINQGVYGWSCRATGGCAFGTYNLGNNNQMLGLKNNAAELTKSTLALELIASQSGDFITGYASGQGSTPWKVSVTGKGFFANLRDTAFAAAGVVVNDASGDFTSVAPSTSGNVLTSNGSAWVSSAAASAGCAAPVLTKTAAYTIVTGDFTCANKVLFVEANCSSTCTITLPAASNTGFEIKINNIGIATANIATAGSDTFGSTTDTVWAMLPGGDPQSANDFWANGGTRWNGQ